MQDHTPFSGDESASWFLSRAAASTSPASVHTTRIGRLAKMLSAVLHPLLVLAYLFLVLFWMMPGMMGVSNPDVRLRILLLLVVATSVVPLISIYMLHRLGSIQSLAMQQRQDRLFALVATTLFYALTTWLFFKQLSVLYMITAMLAAATLCLSVVTLISVFWKISTHSVAICGAAGFLLALYYKNEASHLLYPLLGFIILAGLLMSARLYIQTHSPAQVLGGAFLGVATSIVTVWLVA